jgi:beta-galactosidase
LNQGWAFHRVEPGEPSPASGSAVSGAFDDAAWEHVCLPHAAKLDSPYCGPNYFKGVCWYRRVIPVSPAWRGKRVSAVFDGAMQQAEVWVNGKQAMTHLGGYLPFVVDLTPWLDGPEIVLALCLDNRASAQFPPGSDRIDFGYHGGLYRPARLVVTDPVHITDPVAANKAAGGGVFVRYENVTSNAADVLVQANVRNDGSQPASLTVAWQLLDPAGARVAQAESTPAQLAPAQDADLAARLQVRQPKLWHPDHPQLYTLVTEVRKSGKVCDRQQTRCGIRTLAYTDDGFFINGEKLVLRGANRHQSFPWLGNAAPDSLQYRDIRLLKEAGFNFVRLAHYPQSTAVMDACDELGVLALVCTPGWQFFANNDSFKNQARQNIRDMVRWHRNHPSAVLWEVSLNETYGHDDFFAECAAIARAEYPGGQLFTSGDAHGSRRVDHYDLTYTEWGEFYNRPLHPGARLKKGLHREYGDYEFGGQASSTRVPRGAGEEKLLLQAWNYQWAHNRNLSWPHTIGDAIWAGIDNPSTFDKLNAQGRGLGSWWGPLDLYRLPKFSYYFFQSQRDPALKLPNCDSGPMVHIAGYWTPRSSPAKVVVYSNGDEVELQLNGKTIARQKPDHGPDSDYGAYRAEADPMYWAKNQDTFEATGKGQAKGKGNAMFDGGNCRQLDHPPFTFVPVPFEPGELKAVAYLHGRKIAEHALHTPGKPAALRLRAPELGRKLRADGADALFVYAEVVDAKGELVPDANPAVRFQTEGPGSLVTPDTMPAEAGIASALLRAGTKPGKVTLTAAADGLPPSRLSLTTHPQHP